MVEFLPKEVDRFLSQFNCPLCNSHIVINIYFEHYPNPGNHAGGAVCEKDSEHYSINFAWCDPIKISLDLQILTFVIENKWYRLTLDEINLFASSIEFGECADDQSEPENMRTVFISRELIDISNFSEKAMKRKIDKILLLK